MTKRDLFIVILKLSGLYLAIQFIVVLQVNISHFFFESYVEYFYILINLLSLFLVYILIYKPHLIVDLFKLSEGFDTEELTTEINENALIRVSLIVISIYLVVINVDDFITQSVMYFNESLVKGSNDPKFNLFGYSTTDYRTYFSSILSLIIGFLILTNHKRLANWIQKKASKNA